MELLIEENLLGGKHGNNNLRKIRTMYRNSYYQNVLFMG